MKDFFSGKVIWITGSSKGIGKATAQLIGSFGANIVLNGRNREALLETQDQMEQLGIKSLPLDGDISQPEQCEKMVNEIISHFGKLDVLINNAATASMGLFSDTLPETWERIMSINTLGPIYATRAALPHLLASQGSVIFISSLAGKVGMPGHSTYSVSKMPLTALARALQTEYDKRALHTGILYVGFTENESDKKIMAPDGSLIELKKRDNIKVAGRDKVALAIASMIRKRTKRRTLSFIGQMQKIVGSIFPDIIDMLVKNQHKKNFHDMYDHGNS